MVVGTGVRALLIGAVSALVIGGGLPASAVAAPASDAATPRWSAAKLPGGDTVLTGAIRPDAHTTWTAGFRLADEDGVMSFQPVVYTHDDRRDGPWTEMPTAPGAAGRVNALAATSARDAWLVGDAGFEGEPAMTQHWDGRTWRVKPAPMPANSVSGGLLSVDAVTPDNVWAAGWAQVIDRRIPDPDGGPSQIIDHQEGLIEHWDGHAWHRVALPEQYANWGLNAISASGPKDVWAVGSGYGDDDRPVVLHYDGRSWTALPTPPYGGLYGEFNDVAANGPHDVWAVGRTLLDENDRGHALIMHWNGRTWTRLDGPPDAGPLTGLATTRDGIVAVGNTVDRDSGYALRVAGTRVTSLGFPLTADGTTYAPWKVSAAGREVTVSGAFNYAGQRLPQPMLLSARL
ncbi:hypothetical protein [Streptomyces sp. H39-S7]|uniref:hypothetical protein n=1 Tax=Streptomyces sp. H39-S7 TaxID=3004357 RepID=UPI0022AF964F|nr:hypothetical protein [Streptomyces sp. H39-S7]MCZ4119917.1 hypothetical protein [Streptomyces sp. H39-S7]